MLIFWSPHARSLFAEILQTIAHERSLEDAIRWRVKIGNVVSLLDRLPEMGSAIPPECFFNAPTDSNHLRQTSCGPYRIVYEIVAEEVHILSIRHSRMLIAGNDTAWN